MDYLPSDREKLTKIWESYYSKKKPILKKIDKAKRCPRKALDELESFVGTHAEYLAKRKELQKKTRDDYEKVVDQLFEEIDEIDNEMRKALYEASVLVNYKNGFNLFTYLWRNAVLGFENDDEEWVIINRYMGREEEFLTCLAILNGKKDEKGRPL